MPEPEWFPAARAAAQSIDNALRGLESKYSSHIFSGEVDFRRSREDIAEVKDLFSARLIREDRERLWKHYESIRNDISAHKHGQYEARKLDSQQKREAIAPLLQSAMAYAKAARTNDDFAKVKAMLADALAKMKPGWTGYGVTTEMFALRPGRLTKEDNDCLWNAYQEVQQALQHRRDDVYGGNHRQLLSEARDALSYAQSGESLRDASDRLKGVQAQLKDMAMGKEQRDSVRAIIQQGFDVLARRSDEYKREKERKHQEWYARQLDGIARLESARAKTEVYADHVRGTIRDLEDKIASAWSDDFRSRHEGWLYEARSKLSDVERSLSELDAKIRDARGRLN